MVAQLGKRFREAGESRNQRLTRKQSTVSRALATRVPAGLVARVISFAISQGAPFACMIVKRRRLRAMVYQICDAAETAYKALVSGSEELKGDDSDEENYKIIAARYEDGLES